MASITLEKKTHFYALSFKKQRKKPSVVIGAEFSRSKKIAKSGPIPASILVNKLREKLLSIGDLYTKVNGNTIGCCAEVNSANHILAQKPFLKLNHIIFSKALRPRTMQEISQCKNCKQTFM